MFHVEQTEEGKTMVKTSTIPASELGIKDWRAQTHIYHKISDLHLERLELIMKERERLHALLKRLDAEELEIIRQYRGTGHE